MFRPLLKTFPYGLPLSRGRLPPHTEHGAETMPDEPLGILRLSLPQREEQMSAQRLAMR